MSELKRSLRNFFFSFQRKAFSLSIPSLEVTHHNHHANNLSIFTSFLFPNNIVFFFLKRKRKRKRKRRKGKKKKKKKKKQKI
jgi:hypothetical protein